MTMITLLFFICFEINKITWLVSLFRFLESDIKLLQLWALLAPSQKLQAMLLMLALVSSRVYFACNLGLNFAHHTQLAI